MAQQIVKVEGLRDLEKSLAELPKSTGKAVLRKILKKAGQPIAKRANELAPNDETTQGGLSESYVVSTKLNRRQARIQRRAGKASVEMYVGTNDPAGLQQEFGNQNHGPQSHFRPAWDAHKMGALDIIKDNLGDEIMAAARRLAAKQARLAAKG